MKRLILIASIFISINTYSQEGVKSFFKSTRIINSHSVKNLPKGQMDFRMNHRFGAINSGFYDLFGLDYANTSFSLDYAALDDLLIGIRRSTYQKTYELYSKYNLLSQYNEMPLSLSLFCNISYKTEKFSNRAYEFKNSYRFDYLYQIILAKQVSNLYLQLSPTFIHYNLVKTKQEQNDLLDLGMALEYKLSKKISLVAEYNYRLGKILTGSKDPVSLGINYETYNHTFQLIITNSSQMSEKGVINQTYGNISKGELYLGFNMSKTINL